jgi:signal transduction histidine kinase/CheY-like chemotaxis protein
MANDKIDATGEGGSSEAWRWGLASVVALVAALLLIALVVMVANSNRARDAALARERHSYDIMVITGALDASMARSEAALGRFVISGDKNTGALYYDEWRRAGRYIRRLATSTADNPRQTALVRELQQLYADRGRELAEPATSATFRQGWSALGLFNEAGKSKTVPRIAQIVAELAANERVTLGQRSQIAEVAAARSNSLAGLLSTLGVVLALGAIVLGWLTVQAIGQRRAERRRALQQTERAETLEQAVAERTRELFAANQRLLEEAATRAKAEEQLRQVHKMEAVGQLTGGIAHDFNNMLAVVIGGLDLARRRLNGASAEVGRHIDNAMEGANRAAALTRRLLAFARAEPLMPEGAAPGALIAGMSDLLDRTLGERITVHVEQPDEVWQVWVDRHQLENTLLNLAVNARDAMDNEGRLSIVTSNVTLGEHEAGEAPAGDYVRIDVTDNGCGMSPAVLEHAFEPFFTTKPVGKGTGLGLSQIFGFVRQSKGEVTIRSAPGAGTTVSLFLPRLLTSQCAADIRYGQRETQDQLLADGLKDGIVLVVEDDARVRVATIGALEELGYQTLGCGSAEEAIEALRDRYDIGMIITDVVMPGMTGPEMVRKIAPLYPHIAVLFVTGYVGEAGETEQFANYEVLRKPFTVNALARAVTTAMARAGRSFTPVA